MNRHEIRQGDALEVLRTLPDASAQCCVSSPPYWGLRDYGVEGQLGLEATPQEYVERMVDVFREVRRVLREDGTCWINLGDSYAGSWGAQGRQGKTGALAGRSVVAAHQIAAAAKRRHGTGRTSTGLKPKDLVGIPWSVAFALRDDGWWLRADIVWCLSGGAWVYARTQKGDGPIMVKDLVRLRPSTVRLWNGERWTRALGWNRSADTSERLEIVLRSGERIGCTGPHLWPTQRGNVAARDLKVGDVIQTCTIPEPDGAVAPAYLTEDACWLAGLYLAEGSRSEDTIQLSLHADEAQWLERIERTARHFGGTMAHTIDGQNLAVRLYGRVITAVIDSIVGGRVALDKHIRAEVWRLPNAALHAIIEGYLDGDAHHDARNGRKRLGFCRNYALERDLRTAAARLGATITLKPAIATYQGGRRASFHGEWRWTRSGHWNEKDRGEVVEIRASRARQFWDIGVEDEPHLFALASGVLTHNSKPNPLPESVADRPTKAHEYLFLLAKSERYFYDADAIREPLSPKTKTSWGTTRRSKGGDALGAVKADNWARSVPERKPRPGKNGEHAGANKRSVWTVASSPFSEAHFATFPPKLIEPCILAGSRPGDLVLDPFSGAGTTGVVALQHGRRYLGIELNPAYVEMSERRIKREAGQRTIFDVAPTAVETVKRPADTRSDPAEPGAPVANGSRREFVDEPRGRSVERPRTAR